MWMKIESHPGDGIPFLVTDGESFAVVKSVSKRSKEFYISGVVSIEIPDDSDHCESCMLDFEPTHWMKLHFQGWGFE